MKIYLSFLILVGFISISNALQKVNSVTVNDVAIEKDTLIYPKTDSSYLVKLLIPGKFKLDEINYDANTMEWFGLFGNGVSFKIKKFIPEHLKTTSADGKEVHEIKPHDSLNTILLMSGVELQEKEVIKMQLGRKTLGAGDILDFDYNGKKMVFMVEGQEKKDKTTKKIYHANYKLFIAGKKGKGKTLLLQHKRVDDILPEIVFVGDLDNDKKPDLIINNRVVENENHYVLYLSNNPPKGSLYKVMGVFNFSN